jgi:multisubunit Na+/H+ antiporter MnhC subunit
MVAHASMTARVRQACSAIVARRRRIRIAIGLAIFTSGVVLMALRAIPG